MRAERPGPTGRVTPLDPEREICVLGTFRLRVAGRVVDAGVEGSQRLLAFLALQDRAVARTTVAGTLWPEASDHHAHSSLRSAVARLNAATRSVVVSTPSTLRLGEVAVDVHRARDLAIRLLERATPADADSGGDAVASLSEDVLPGWGDDWAVLEGEEWRQLRLHALESLARHLTSAGHHRRAMAAAHAAMRADALRESARAALIGVHLAEGNRSEAVRELQRFETVLADRLGIQPTRRLRDLVAGA